MRYAAFGRVKEEWRTNSVFRDVFWVMVFCLLMSPLIYWVGTT